MLLDTFLRDLENCDPETKSDLLIETAERFVEVPAEVAVRPFPESCRVPGCESEAFIFTRPNPDGTFKFYFAVENPQGISAKAIAVILDDACSGASLEEIQKIPEDVIYQIFGRAISMGKGQGLMSLVAMVKALAKVPAL